MRAYYNDCDKFVAQWTRNLIKAGMITPGEVDERPIQEVSPDDLKGFDRCHFFCGINGWDLALTLAGWEGPVWTGSCPCQPFSAAGGRAGAADPRHLWPDWHRLIGECRPGTVFGEQVAGAVGFGWLDGVCADLEGDGYAVGAAVLGAHSVGAPHIRQRLWWVAHAERSRTRTGGRGRQPGSHGDEPELHESRQTRSEDGGMVLANGTRGSAPPREHDTGVPLSQQVAGWATPRSVESGHTRGSPERSVDHKSRLEDQVHGWATPSARDHKSEAGPGHQERMAQTRGKPLSRHAARTDGRGALAPEFSRWLLGFPTGWENFADSATP